MAAMVRVGELLDGHVSLDLECLDRIYLNGYVPNLQVGGQVVVPDPHLGFPIPSPAILEKIGLGFRKAVTAVRARTTRSRGPFAKGERKLEVMRPYLDRLAVTGAVRGGGDRGGPGVPAGVHRHHLRIPTPRGLACRGSATPRPTGGSPATTSISGDETSGRRSSKSAPTFRTRSSLAQRPRVGQTRSGRGRDRVHRARQRVRRLDDPAGLQALCDPLGPGRDPGVLPSAGGPRLPLPLTDGGPGRRVLVGAVDAPGRGLRTMCSTPRATPGVLRGAGGRQPRHRPPRRDRDDLRRRRVRHARPPEGHQTRCFARGTEVTLNAYYKHSRVKQYLKDGRALRIETVINDTGDLGCRAGSSTCPKSSGQGP